MSNAILRVATRCIGVAAATLLPLAVTTPAAGQSGGGYDLTWNVIAGGGGTAHKGGGVYSLRGTIGQSSTDVLAGGDYTLTGGFWAVPPGKPADVNGDGSVDVADLLLLVYSFGTVEGDPGYDPACDFNDDGSVDVVDLLMLVKLFGT
jgi:hypothetical protein